MLAWWPRPAVTEKHTELQRHFYEFPGTHGIEADSAGNTTTLDLLHGAKDSESLVCAVLLLASLFPRLESRRSHYSRNTWPPRYCVSAVSDMAAMRLNDSSQVEFCSWHPSCTTVLPSSQEDWIFSFDSINGLISHLAREHAVLLLNYAPVEIQFSEEPDPFVAQRVLADEKRRKKQHEEWMKKAEARKLEEDKKLESLKKKHSRYGEFHQVSDQELEKLVWTKPTRELANDFGISDVAISKQCKNRGIKKPPRGFWAQVQAGKIPHPAGKPQRD